ncbi:hypothetical protein [Streptomyces sp. B6B3]|uniref:hypothetical protein n=1 Tax=Streptomyces sp. B6B3 TaxID=3153570 RepID=UPI00325F3654
MTAGAGLRLLRAAVFAAACATLAAAGHLTTGGPGIALWALALGWFAVFAVAAPLAGRERRSAPALAAVLAVGQLALHLLYCLGQHSSGHDTATVGGAMAGGPAGHGQHGTVLELASRLLCNDHAAGLTEAEATRVVAAAGLDPTGGPGGGAGTAGAAAHPAGGGLADAVASLASWPMLLGHLLAALAAGWLLRRGEAALWRLVRLSARWSVEARVALATLPFLPYLRRLLRALLRGPRPYTVPGPPRPPGHHPTPATRGTVLPHAVIRRGPPRSHVQLVLAA